MTCTMRGFKSTLVPGHVSQLNESINRTELPQTIYFFPYLSGKPGVSAHAVNVFVFNLICVMSLIKFRRFLYNNSKLCLFKRAEMAGEHQKGKNT